MPPQRTRKLFFGYHTRVRPARPGKQHEKLAAWNAKSQDEKAVWVEAYREMQRTERLTAAQRPVAQGVWDTIVAQRDAPYEDASPELAQAFEIVGNAIQQLEPFMHLMMNERQAWTDLRDLEQAQPLPDVASIAALNNKISDRTQRGNLVLNCVGTLQSFIEKPQVPLDRNDNERVPARWGPVGDRNERRNAIKQRNDEVTGTAGLQAPGRVLTGGLLIEYYADQYLQRVFRKSVKLSSSNWTDARRWEGDMRDVNAKVPLELACHDAMMNAVGVVNVVQLRERFHRGLIDNETQTYKLYVEWSPYGDLADLINSHLEQDTHIPEPFIWYVAECLAEVGLGMQQGSLGLPRQGWQEIVHRDLKPGNVFLGTEDPKLYDLYPMLTLGDFGLAFKTSADDPNNPRWYNNDIGTPGFKAPEQQRWVENNTFEYLDEHRLDHKTNVYGVGMILWSLVSRNHRPEQPTWLGIAQDNRTLAFPDTQPFPLDQYSQEVLDLVQQCIAFDPTLRPTFTEVLRAVRNAKHMHQLARTTPQACGQIKQTKTRERLKRRRFAGTSTG